MAKRELIRVIEKFSFKNMPENGKEPGTIRCKVISKGWRENLTIPEQVKYGFGS
ncbi:MAG TPA: hypothetical protein VNA27_07895 [Rubrobacteraceae bacterium]|nr:hypothetical protein [Rubrobacteraceae bacterium]